VLTSKITHMRSLLFRQQDGVHSEVRRVYLAITTKVSRQSSAVSGLRMLTMLCPRWLWSILANVYSLFQIQNVINLNMCHAPGDEQV